MAVYRIKIKKLKKKTFLEEERKATLIGGIY